MKIIDQSHEILQLPDISLIEVAGRTCYKSEDNIGCTKNYDLTDNCPIWIDGSKAEQKRTIQGEYCRSGCQHHSSHKFIKMLLDRGHHAVIEFGDIIVRFVTNRGVTHELVRHRLFSFAQESTRYVRYDGQMEFIRPVWWFQVSRESQIEWVCAMEQAEGRYHNLLAEDWRPEQAREVLPNSLKTEIVVKGNIREWRHCLTLRTSKKAHPQIRALMLPLLEGLKKSIPIVFDDINNENIN
jgi:thymidylate synthase (FAD)